MKKAYQVTLVCTTGQYRPVSCVVEMEQNSDCNLLLDREQKKIIINKGVQKICVKRYWTNTDLKKYNYLRVKTREYKRE